MSDQDQQFQNLWEFSRVETDWESLSDDHHSRHSAASDPKFEQETILFSGTENAQQTMHSPTSQPSGETENQSTFEEPNQPGRTVKRKPRTGRTKRATSNREPSDAALLALKEHMESLVEEIKTTGEKLIAWMASKLKSPSNDDDIVFFKPSWAKKGQRNNIRRPRDNLTDRKGKTVTVSKNCEDGSSGSRSPPTTEVVVLPEEGEDVVMDAITNKKKEKQKGKASSSSIKKQKSVGPEAVRWTDAGHLKLPTALPQKQAESSEEMLLESVNMSEFGEINALNSGVNLRSRQLNTGPRVMQYDHLTLPTALPQKQSERSEEMLLESVNMSDFGEINAMNSGVNLRSHQLNTGPRVMQYDHLTLPTALPQKQAERSEEVLLESVNMSDFGEINALNSGVNLRSRQLNTGPRVMQYDHLTLPTALPQKQAERSEEKLLESVNMSDFGRINAPNPRVNLRSHQLNTDPRVMRNDAVMTQTGLMNNVSGYEQSTGLTMGNGIGNAFPFPLVPQGSCLENGVRKILSPLALQYLTQRTMVSGMYQEPLGFSTGNHAFMGSYCALNQNLNYNAQQGGVVMALQPQDMIRGASNQGIP